MQEFLLCIIFAPLFILYLIISVLMTPLKFIITLSIIFMSWHVAAQHKININAHVRYLPPDRVYLGAIRDGKLTLLDSMNVTTDSFTFSERDTLLKKGLYYVILNKAKTSYLQLIVDKEDVAFHTVYQHI